MTEIEKLAMEIYQVGGFDDAEWTWEKEPSKEIKDQCRAIAGLCLSREKTLRDRLEAAEDQLRLLDRLIVKWSDAMERDCAEGDKVLLNVRGLRAEWNNGRK